jgi:hypothetical protein
MSGRVFLLGVALCLLTLAFLLTDRLVYPPGITEANVRRIRPGMRVADVEALLGGKARIGPAFHLWVGEEGEAVVKIGADGRVEWAGFLHSALRPSPTASTLFARLRTWLGW